MDTCDLLVSADRLLDGIGNVYSAGVAVAIREGVITEIGAVGEMINKWHAADHCNLEHTLLMPGLINAHTHVPMTFLRGFADDLPLMNWLEEHIFPVEAKLTDRIVALGARLGMYEMMRTGTTAFVDSYLLEENVLHEAFHMGMRCAGGEAVFAFPSPAYRDLNDAETLYRRLAERFGTHGRIQVVMMPHSVYTTDDEVLKHCLHLSEELDMMLHIHLSESEDEVKKSRQLHNGLSSIMYAHKIGLLNDRSHLAHMVNVTNEELSLLASSGVGVVHNPVSNLKLASGIARIPDMLNAGIPIGLGTDGACSNNSLDMFETMKLAAILAKGASGDATQVPASRALKMATVESARIFRTPHLGTLVPGAPADMIALDLNEPNLNPLYHDISHVVYAASGKDCVMTMVDGRILYYRGEYTDGGYNDTIAEMRELVDWVRSI